ncbi:restriction endonuclease subunit S [Levilactobacillus tangyuanensis]|uniref:Restriction endonuclease subunit S n=1 Tax=Levilactobacillus tangyuanensis TaxID=2486021 RepID=A0ABW1TNF0_9LACO|nr:restriction endonuclease subunit S [Levilactobacillus tangyuanensis]
MNNVKEIIDFRGRTPKKLGLTWTPSGSFAALSALNIKNGYIDTTVDAHFGDELLYSRWMKSSELRKDDIIFTTEAPMGNVVVLHHNDHHYILSQRVIALRPDVEMVNSAFLGVALTTPGIHQLLRRLSTGGTAHGVSQRNLKFLEFMVPGEISEQKKIGQLSNFVDALIVANERQRMLSKKGSIEIRQLTITNIL